MVTLTPASNVTDASGTITLGGTAQAVFGQVPLKGYAIYNPDTVDLWIRDDGTAAVANAAGTIRVVANGGGYETPPAYRPSADVSIVGANTSQKYTAKRW